MIVIIITNLTRTMSVLGVMKNNWKHIALGGVVATASITLFTYSFYSYFVYSYPSFVSLPGPFKKIGCSYHRIPNNTRFKLYYPTSLQNIKKSNSKQPNTYFKDPESLITLNKKIGIPFFLLSALNNLKYAYNPMPCFEDAPINKNKTNNNDNVKYPLLIFSHGNSCNFDLYCQILSGLASYGIVVAIIDHTDGSALYTKLSNKKDLFYQTGYLLNQNGEKYVPKPWKIEHDVADFGNQRLKPIRVPEYIELYKYLTKTSMENIVDDKLLDILNMTDLDNLIFGGQSFGASTCWMASNQINDDRIKGLLLLDPWFGCIDIEELKGIKWKLPALVLSSQSWMEKKPEITKRTQIVMSNGLNKNNYWEYGKSFVHYDSSDVALWGPSWMTTCRKLLTPKEWSDLICKRCAKFIVENIPQLKEKGNITQDALECNTDYIVNVDTLTRSQL